jgi:O-antigen/teichoic acid export membrane protein
MSVTRSFILNKFNDPVFTFQYYQVIRYVVSFLISVIMVRSGLQKTDLGYYEVWIFIVTSLTFFWSAGIKNALLSYYPPLDKKTGNELISAVFWVLSGVGVLLGLILWVIPHTITSLFIGGNVLPYTLWIAIYLMLSVPIVLTENILYLNGLSRQLINYTHWSQGGLLLLFIVVSIYNPVLIVYIYALVLALFFRFLYLFYLLFGREKISFQTKELKLFLVFAIPLIINMLLGSIMDFIDGWFVTKFYDASYFPVFRYGARELPFSTILFSSLSAAMIPVLIREGIAASDMRRRVNRLMHILFPASIVIMIVSPFIFPWVYSSEFKESAFIFNIYLLIISSRVLMPQTYNFALHQHKIILWSAIIEIVANVMLSYWWMQIWGVYGLAFATVVAYFIQKAILIWYNYRKNNIPISNYLDMRYYLMYCILLLATFFVTFNYF